MSSKGSIVSTVLGSGQFSYLAFPRLLQKQQHKSSQFSLCQALGVKCNILDDEIIRGIEKVLSY